MIRSKRNRVPRDRASPEAAHAFFYDLVLIASGFAGCVILLRLAVEAFVS